jgi:lipopolysaccharide export LptBFGC system permease protein LptF
MNAFVLSLYVGYALYGVFPFINGILGNNTPAARTIISFIVYGIFVGLSFYIFRKIGFSHRTRKPWHLIILTVLSVGFILAVGYHLFAIDRLITLPPTITVFFTDTYFFWWFIAPIVGVLLLAL